MTQTICPPGDTVSAVGELALIRTITSRLAMPTSVVVGPGDDAAVVEPVRGALDVFTTDTVVDGVHVDSRFVPPEAIGHRALAVNLSDLAAMGAAPRLALLSLALPPSTAVSTVERILDGLLALAGVHQVALIGGNVTRTSGPLVVDVTAVGSVHPRRILRRSGARPGDEVYVTGTLGDAAVGLEQLQADPASWPATCEGRTVARTVARYLRPTPRVRAGLLLGRARVASGGMDLSDGLADGLRQMADASSVGITIDAAALPVSDDVRAWHAGRQRNAVLAACQGGDDYELLFTVRPASARRLRVVRDGLGDVPITRIGVVTKTRTVQVAEGAHLRELGPGFDHFRPADGSASRVDPR
jgi:thiamine-monophosphate kinase